MMKNVGRLDRAARTLLAIAMLLGAWRAPLAMLPRAGLAALGTYFAITVLLGTCLGYRMMGLSSCPRSAR
jgi:hypothetical protein